jgi:hypothetical protein
MFHAHPEKDEQNEAGFVRRKVNSLKSITKDVFRKLKSEKAEDPQLDKAELDEEFKTWMDGFFVKILFLKD